MTVQELGSLHRRYVELSDRFRAAWTFHQFVGSLNKVILNRAPEQESGEFQEVYAELKDVSLHLNTSSTSLVRERLDAIERQLNRLVRLLLDEDSRIEPSGLRRFFGKVKNSSPKILTHLVKFYLYGYDGQGWARERLDKIDFLVSRVAVETETGEASGVAADREATRELLKGLWQILGTAEPASAVVEDRRREIVTLGHEMQGIGDFDELHRRRLVERYRELKHALGALFFYPEVLTAILDTNLRFRERIQALYRNEERRIFSDYQQIFELEREAPVDGDLQRELTEFRHEIERFERQLQGDDLSLADLAEIRERVRALLPRLTARRGGQPTGAAVVLRPAVQLSVAVEQENVLAEVYERVIEALDGCDPEVPPRAAVLSTAVFALRLEPREVVAHRRLGDDGSGDHEVERFLLEAAALRVRMNDEAAEIRGILDDTMSTGEAPVLARARNSARLADRFLHRFAHHLEQAVSDGNVEEARDFQLLRMRLMRDYSGLWLLINKPLREGLHH